MHIYKIEVENYRLLQSFSMDLEKELSLLIGKNNTGKTSILTVLDKFLSEKNRFLSDDFNLDFRNKVKDIIEREEIDESEYKANGIKLRLFIQYSDQDDLSNISQVLMDLDPDNNTVVLSYEYILPYREYLLIKSDFTEFCELESEKKRDDASYSEKNFNHFFKTNYPDYFKTIIKSIEYNIESKSINPENFINLTSEGITTKDIISFKFISAKREVGNKEINSTLSNQTSRIYERTEESPEQHQAVDKFKDTLSATDTDLSEIYRTLFEDIVEKVKTFGGIKQNESEIEIISTLQHRQLLDGNTTVVYKHDDDNQLPEHFNGLGYMNLISMIFEIEILVNEFKKSKEQKPADINLLFIEEPEAHTHPQMQYVFIKNIKSLLEEGIKRDDGENRPLQYIISTHSSCIVADSKFEDIKYLIRDEEHGVSSKNLKNLQNEYDTYTSQYQFLKQYLTISRAEIFFADKAILIEGDTERILIPTLLRKVDLEESENDEYLPLLSQNISIVEVGAYFKIFEKFINFIGIKTLVITDIDSRKRDESGDLVACRVEEGEGTSNTSITHFLNEKEWEELKEIDEKERVFNLGTSKVYLAYQTEEEGYHARSFEDAFIHINKEFIKDNTDTFRGLKNRDLFDDDDNCDAYDLAEKCIKKKTHFALDILYHSDEHLKNWNMPAYINEGLIWLKKD